MAPSRHGNGHMTFFELFPTAVRERNDCDIFFQDFYETANLTWVPCLNVISYYVLLFDDDDRYDGAPLAASLFMDLS